MGKLIILARYWNDMDFLQASLDQIDYWTQGVETEVYLAEGAWDQKLKPRSTDGTREYLEAWTVAQILKGNHVVILNNKRTNKNYRINQAETSNFVMQLANWQPDDWMMIVDVDQFYTKADIDFVKETIRSDRYDFFTNKVCNFFYDLQHCQETIDSSQSRLPSRLVEGSRWIATNHLTVNGIRYKSCSKMQSKNLFDTHIQGLHYEGLRPKSRLDLRYSVGNRKTFWDYKDGIRLRNLVPFIGKHSEFVANNLKGCCIFSEEILKFVKLHCNMDVSLYHNPPEIEVTKKYFENKFPRNVLELGCGLGRNSVGFYKAFPSWKKTNFFLLDGNSGDEQICGKIYDSQKDFYNRLKLTKEFCLANGIPADQLNILNAEEPDVFYRFVDVKFDFVYSFLAIGYHWPIDLYLKKLLPYLHSGSILCFGIRPAKHKSYCKFNDFQLNSISMDEFEVLEMVVKGDFDSVLVLRKT